MNIYEVVPDGGGSGGDEMGDYLTMFRHNSWTDTETDTNRKLEIISTCGFYPVRLLHIF